MGRRHERADPRQPSTAAEPRRNARFARAEVVDVLAEGLWSLILAGRWPGAAGPDDRTPDPSGGNVQPMENAGV